MKSTAAQSSVVVQLDFNVQQRGRAWDVNPPKLHAILGAALKEQDAIAQMAGVLYYAKMGLVRREVSVIPQLVGALYHRVCLLILKY